MTLRTRTLPFLALLILSLTALTVSPAAAAAPDHWVGTWYVLPSILKLPCAMRFPYRPTIAPKYVLESAR
jgi:hypothetical protein